MAQIDSLAGNLMNMKDFKAKVKVLVTLPMAANDEVEYTVRLASVENEADTILGASYLIDWTLPVPSGESHGFSSYFDGNFYRFRDGGGRLQEYHFENDSEPFLTSTPVQTTTQFYESLPVALGNELLEIIADSTYSVRFYPDTVFRGNQVSIVRARREINGVEAANNLYVFDKGRNTPILIEKEMSPGTISEQTVTYTYVNPKDRKTGRVPLTEKELIELYPEPFTLFREGSYALSSLVSKELPPFSLETLDGKRFIYNRTGDLTSPTILAFLDENVGSTSEVIDDVRDAIDDLPSNVDVLWIFLSNRHDEIEHAVERTVPGETTLISGRNIVKDFGVTEIPSMIFVGRDGIIRNVLIGYNQNLNEFVINIMGLIINSEI